MKLAQAEVERRVFKKFFKHTGLNLIRFQSCKPPKPDILCEHQFGNLYFELTDNTSEEIQKSIHARNEEIRKKAYWIDPFPEIYRKKFTKNYKMRSIICELIIYFGNHPVAELGDHFDNRLQKHIEWIRQNINQSEFQKVWIYDYHQDKVLVWVDGRT